MKKNKKGFTLIELLVVVAIIGILAGLLIPGLMKKTVDAKVKTACGNAKTVSNTVSIWLQDEMIKDITHEDSVKSGDSGINDLKASLGKLDTVWYAAINDNGDVDYALWAKSGDCGEDQLTEKQCHDKKGKVGCYPYKAESEDETDD